MTDCSWTPAGAPQAAWTSTLVLLGHVAKANPHARYLQARPTALATFLAARLLPSPAGHPDRQRVPTWNYLGRIARCSDAAGRTADKDVLLKHLIGEHRAQVRRAVALDGPVLMVEKMLAGIAAFELRVLRWQCSQLQPTPPESHAAMRAAYARGDAGAQALGVWMDRLGLAAGAPTPPPDGT